MTDPDHCPFCREEDGEEVEIYDEITDGGKTIFFARCNYCGARGPDHCYTAERATTEWNKAKR